MDYIAYTIPVSMLIVGSVVGFFGKFGDGWVKEKFAKRARIMRHKVDVANNVHRILHQASVAGYTNSPKSIEDLEKIHSTETDVTEIDEEMGKVFGELVHGWVGMTLGKFTIIGNEEESKKAEHNKWLELEAKRRILLQWTGKIRTGN